jgi:thiol-disulfide isomerase/thioredoxin
MIPPEISPPNPPKPRRRRWLMELALVLLAVVAVHAYQTWHTARGIAPPLEGHDLEGRALALADLRGRPVLVHFWATWCPVCRLEQDSIEAISRDWTVLSVALEDTPAADLQTFMDKEGLSFPVLRDSDGRLAARYGVRGVPASFVVDAGGEIRFTSVGYTTGIGLRLRLWLAAKLQNAESGLHPFLAAEPTR